MSRELQKLQKTTAKQRLCALIRDELVLEVTSELTREAIDEYFEIDRLANAKGKNTRSNHKIIIAPRNSNCYRFRIFNTW